MTNQSSFKLKMNIGKVQAAHRKAFADLAMLAETKMVQVISDNRNWPGFKDTRDIVDTGMLRANRSVKIEGLTALYIFAQEYALYVHEGYTLRNGAKQPGRPWTAIAIQEMNAVEAFKKLLEIYLKA